MSDSSKCVNPLPKVTHKSQNIYPCYHSTPLYKLSPNLSHFDLKLSGHDRNTPPNNGVSLEFSYRHDREKNHQTDCKIEWGLKSSSLSIWLRKKKTCFEHLYLASAEISFEQSLIRKFSWVCRLLQLIRRESRMKRSCLFQEETQTQCIKRNATEVLNNYQPIICLLWPQWGSFWEWNVICKGFIGDTT